MKLLTVSCMFAGAACVLGAPVSFSGAVSHHENNERRQSMQYAGDERSAIESRDPVSVNVSGNVKVPQPYPVEKIVEKVVEKIVDRPVPQPYPVEVVKHVPQPYPIDRSVPQPYPVHVPVPII
ncbi:hypothetical protein RhiXN_08856 [Rhizoctonia solani]|uniref:Uncharacterized protein n=1 Tax=Rhizoctonia solani TaxID=456999 RepID=A0A8H8NWY1_9AGAM|nr:uncharacterized protein RhiXN_08856 [Rhizoctonia solani]QRW19881.1 hypothetical protein RhiXN_08856 [Rhizoctonia solani]